MCPLRLTTVHRLTGQWGHLSAAIVILYAGHDTDQGADKGC